MTKNSKKVEPGTKLNYDDITIVPEEITEISSRSECNPYDENGYLPIFASCMSSVTSIKNSKAFNDSKIYTVIPRSYSSGERLVYLGSGTLNFVAFSLNETKELFIDKYGMTKSIVGNNTPRICIDLANGHMKSLLGLVRDVKDKWGESGIIIMTGNIANPETYRDYCDSGVDYCRCGIGGGSVCSTSSNTAIHYPYFSLLQEMYKIKKEISGKCKIIADGNIHGFRDIQKALVYADYVMIGGIFNKAIESAGRTTYGNRYWNIRGKRIFRPLTTLLTYGKEIPQEKYEEAMKLIKEGKLSVWKELYGQSTKIAQAIVAKANNIDLKRLKTSEGLLKYQKVEYDLPGWSENETDYLKSAMSYTNSHTLEEYKDKGWVRITQIRYNN